MTQGGVPLPLTLPPNSTKEEISCPQLTLDSVETAKPRIRPRNKYRCLKTAGGDSGHQPGEVPQSAARPGRGGRESGSGGELAVEAQSAQSQFSVSHENDRIGRCKDTLYYLYTHTVGFSADGGWGLGRW